MKRVYVVTRYDKEVKGKFLVGVWSRLKDVRNFLYDRNDVLIDSTKQDIEDLTQEVLQTLYKPRISVEFANCIYFIEETILDFNKLKHII